MDDFLFAPKDKKKERFVADARAEREARRVSRLRESSATRIQATFRSRTAVAGERSIARSHWDALFQQSARPRLGKGEAVPVSDVHTLMRDFAFFSEGALGRQVDAARSINQAALMLNAFGKPPGADNVLTGIDKDAPRRLALARAVRVCARYTGQQHRAIVLQVCLQATSGEAFAAAGIAPSEADRVAAFVARVALDQAFLADIVPPALHQQPLVDVVMTLASRSPAREAYAKHVLALPHLQQALGGRDALIRQVVAGSAFACALDAMGAQDAALLSNLIWLMRRMDEADLPLIPLCRAIVRLREAHGGAVIDTRRATDVDSDADSDEDGMDDVEARGGGGLLRSAAPTDVFSALLGVKMVRFFFDRALALSTADDAEPLCLLAAVYGPMVGDHGLLNAVVFVPDLLPRLAEGVLASQVKDAALVAFFAACFRHRLLVTDDVEFERGVPVPLDRIPPLVELMRKMALGFYRLSDASAAEKQQRRTIARLLVELHDRNDRHEFCNADLFVEPSLVTPKRLVEDFRVASETREAAAGRFGTSTVDGVDGIGEDEDEDGGNGEDERRRRASVEAMDVDSDEDAQQVRMRSARRRRARGNMMPAQDKASKVWRPILREMPFVIPFEYRAQLFRYFVQSSPVRRFGADEIDIRRAQLYDDAFHGLLKMPSQTLRDGAFRIRFIDEHGQVEQGIDGGGLMKEFVTEVAEHALADYGWFSETGDHRLYPNPDSHVISGDHLRHYEFLGRLVGLAVHQGILIELRLARFFLSKLLGKENYMNDLASFDPDLHRNLVALKAVDDVADLGLTFSLDRQVLGRVVHYDLVPNGANITVSKDNLAEYLFRMSTFHLNTLFQAQSRAFVAGFSTAVPHSWTRMFNESELNLLIGGSDEPVDVEDLRHNTVYGGEYHERAVQIRWFWEIVDAMSAEQRGDLLQFVTGTNRAPLMGFAALNPKFCVHSVPDRERLPTASTCMALLKLPMYETIEIMREKILLAISSGTGFLLS